MAKELPYFRFTCQEWDSGDISLETDSIKGLFMDICSYYWSQNCTVFYTKLIRKFPRKTKQIHTLIQNGIIKRHENSLNINFLDEQWDELTQYREKKRIAGAKGGKQKASNATAKVKHNSSYKEKDKDKDKDKDNLKGNFPHLLSEDFKKEFNEYLDSRKKKATPRAKELLLKKLHKFDLNTSIAMIQQSLENGWVGIFELQSKGSDHKSFRQIDEEKEIEYLKQVENEVKHVKRSGRLGYRPPKSIQGGNNKDISRLQQTDPEINN